MVPTVAEQGQAEIRQGSPRGALEERFGGWNLGCRTDCVVHDSMLSAGSRLIGRVLFGTF